MSIFLTLDGGIHKVVPLKCTTLVSPYIIRLGLNCKNVHMIKIYSSIFLINNG